MLPSQLTVALAALLVAGAAEAAAQCPDGTPPPCRRPAAAAPARRPDPPLDARTWIVLPFENVARVADIDWLRDASVNLLYLDLSRWRDIRVIDDERVADLIREVPAQRGGTQLSLQTGLAVARRAGAGKLVMGDLLKVGTRTQVIAKVFDVRSGQRIRTVREETPYADSLMAIFGRLASGILDAEVPAGENVGTIGTTSLEAYRAYVSGIAALNRVDLDSARAFFAAAIGHDSAFALAHYKQSVVFGWFSPGDPRRLAHAERANRLATTLPPRERALVLGQYQTSRSNWGEACNTYAELLRADSSDVEAWYNLGECNYHDQFVDYLQGDSTQPYFRGSWNLALRAFNRALELDPTYHLAYSHIPDILLAEQRFGCLRRDVLDATCQNTQFLALLLRGGDSLVTRPASAGDFSEMSRQASQAVTLGVWRTNVELTRAAAQTWVNAGPGEARAHQALARALLAQGRPQEAAREFAAARVLPSGAPDQQRIALDRVELLIKLDSVAAAARFVDSLATGAGQGSFPAFLAFAIGRHERASQIFGAGFQGPPQVRSFIEGAMMTMQGAPPADLLEREAAIEALLGSVPEAVRNQSRTQFLMVSAPWTMNLTRPSGAVLEVGTGGPMNQVVANVVARDTSALRASLARLDAEVASWPRELPGATALLIAAEAHLFLHDTTAALARLIEWEARLPYLSPSTAYVRQLGNLTVAVQSWGRAWLRLADLAAARGDRVTAVRNYRRVVALWENAAPALQPHVTRARAAIAAGN